MENPIPILLGFLCQYGILPLLAFTISKVANLSPAFATGLIILGCCPGGQASNVATFVARGDVALSVLMTTASTMAAAVMTPLLASLLAGQFVPVDAWGLAESTARLVLLPTIAGVALNELFPRTIAKIRPAMPLLALLLTVVLCAVPVAQVADVLRAVGVGAIGPVVLLHGFGYFLGYALPRLLRFGERTARTVSIETGMQSAAMGYALSTKHFADIMVAVPSSVSIVVMVWMGAALAAAWRMMPTKEKSA
jgi:BASS family bile acid:Na+ symporter